MAPPAANQRSLPKLLAAAAELDAFLTDRGWRYCVIGGLAVQRWGEVRATGDVDLALLTGYGTERAFIDPLFAAFGRRRPDAEEIADRGRVVLISAANGTPIDISLAALPTEERLLERSTPFEFAPGVLLPTASAEDLIVMKAVAGRGVDERDIAGIITRQGEALDWSIIEVELTTLAAMTDGEVDALPGLLTLREQIETQFREDAADD